MSDGPRRGPGRPKAPPAHSVCIRMPQPMYDAFKRVADRHEASVSQVVRTILTKRSSTSV